MKKFTEPDFAQSLDVHVQTFLQNMSQQANLIKSNYVILFLLLLEQNLNFQMSSFLFCRPG